MRICMVGIDHTKALLDRREEFSFTKAGVKDAVTEIMKKFKVKGCILLSTCNRTELWISQWEDEKMNIMRPSDILCQLKNIDPKKYEEFFVEREDMQAVEHLLKLVCGFESRIFGEDQIISQVREALQSARECKTADGALEKVFQRALSAGKRVRTEVHLSAVNRSSADDTVEKLKSVLGDLKGVNCLVIGNGQMGKLVANNLIAQGAKVTMTLRRRIHGSDEQDSIMPIGCSMISYDDRIAAIRGNQVIISATLSPHFTLRLDDVKDVFSSPCIRGKKTLQDSQEGNTFLLFDLAVPRDVDPDIGKLPYVRLWDIDAMSSSGNQERNQKELQLANEILQEYEQELQEWFEFRNYVPVIKEIVELVSEDTVKRMEGSNLQNIEFAAAKDAVDKAASKLIYGLKNQLPRELWGQCLEALHKSAARETLKH